MKYLKCIIAGDSGVGKTAMQLVQQPHSLLSLQEASHFNEMTLKPVGDVQLGLFDIFGNVRPEGYDVMRRQHGYHNTDVIVVCASVDSPLSLHNSLSHWSNEFHPTSHRVPFILCATKIDLRDTERETQLNSSEEGIKMAKRIGAHAYVECSALTMKGVPEVFSIIARVGLKAQEIKRGKKKPKVPKVPKVGLPNKGGCNDGGFNARVQVYDLRRATWLPPLQDVTFPLLHFHTCVAVGTILYIFGGKSNGYSNECYTLHLKTRALKQLTMKGSTPTPRYGHSAVVHGNVMYIFGGYDSNANICNDLYALDIFDHVWTKVETSNPPSRMMSSAVMHDRKMYIFGGLGDNSTALNDLYQYDFVNNEWTQIKYKGKMVTRYGHTAVTSPYGMYIYGGISKTSNKTTRHLADMSVYDFSTNTFIPVQLAPIQDFSRANHTCIWDSFASSLVVIGGKDSFLTTLSTVFSLSTWSFFDKLPPNVTQQILLLLDLEVSGMRRVSRQWYHTCENEVIWESICNTHVLPFCDKDRGSLSFKQFCIENYIKLIISVQKHNGSE